MRGGNEPQGVQGGATVPKERESAFIDDVTVFVPPELAFDKEAMAKIMRWVQSWLLKGGTTIHLTKSKSTFSGWVEEGGLSAD